MKILQINKFFYRRGGADHHFFDLSNLLTRHGVNLAFFSMRDPRNQPSVYEKYFVKNLDFSRFNWRAVRNIFKVFYSFEAKRKLLSLLKNFTPDVAHTHLIYHHLSPSVLSALKKKHIPTVMTVHDWKLICPNHLLFTRGQICERCQNNHYWQCARYRCVKNSFFQSALSAKEAYFHKWLGLYKKNIDLLIAPSQFVCDELVKFGWSSKKIKVLPHFLPVNIRRVDVAPELPKQSRFAFVGRLSPEKGVDKLVDFWIKNIITYPLEIYGDGPLYDELSRKIKTAGNSRITLHGSVPRKHVLSELPRMTAVIAPSVVYETFGLNLIEAMSQGVPVIAARLGALEELVKKSGAGILFNWANSEELAKALHNISDMKYRRRAVDYMRQNHLPEEYFGNLLKIYTELKHGKKS